VGFQSLIFSLTIVTNEQEAINIAYLKYKTISFVSVVLEREKGRI
jgi:hypothetical protein